MNDGLVTYTGFLIRKYARTALIWAAAFSLYCMMMTAVFPSFSDTQSLKIEQFPEALRKAFNIEDISQLTSFLNMEVFSYAPLVLAFFPIMTLAGALAGEEERGGLDIYLANPLSRRAMMLANWIAVAFWMLVITIIMALAIWLTALAVGEDVSLWKILSGTLNLFPICMAAGSFALMVSARLRQKGAVVGIAFGVVFFMYLLDIIGKISDTYRSARWISAFRYYGQAIKDGLNWGHVATLLVASLILLALSIPIFQRRDIYT